MTETYKCPIWGIPAQKVKDEDYGDKVALVSSRAGGQFEMTGSAEAVVAHLSDVERKSLTQWIVESIYSGVDPYITSITVREVRSRSLPHPRERAEWTLRYLVRKSLHIGQKLEFPIKIDVEYDTFGGVVSIGEITYSENSNYLLAWSASTKEEEVNFLLKFLERLGFVELGTNGPIPDIIVQPEGFAHVAEQDFVPSISELVFIAMWFDNSMDDAYENGFERAIRESGYEPLRIDQKEHVNKIDDEIVADIRRSRFIVADFTSKQDKPRGGVYFEAGFAYGLHIPVIWTCREDMIDNVHFDTRQFNHIVWSDAKDLCRKLKNRIGAVIGVGPIETYIKKS